MFKPPSKQVKITEMEAFTINNLLKDRLIQMLRERHPDVYVMINLQKRYEDILAYIRKKDHNG